MWDKKKSYTIYNWKKKGVIPPEGITYQELYYHYDSCENCEICNISFNDMKKCLDHDHKTGLFRNIVCNSCNRVKAVTNINNELKIKYISHLKVEGGIYRIQFIRKGKKYFKQIRDNKVSLEEVIQLRNKMLMDTDGNLNALE
jgi:hypothetical protein